jgi:hypothetical protein
VLVLPSPNLAGENLMAESTAGRPGPPLRSAPKGAARVSRYEAGFSSALFGMDTCHPYRRERHHSVWEFLPAIWRDARAQPSPAGLTEPSLLAAPSVQVGALLGYLPSILRPNRKDHLGDSLIGYI